MALTLRVQSELYQENPKSKAESDLDDFFFFYLHE